MSIEPRPRQIINPASPTVEFGQSYNDITDPTVLFEHDQRIGRYEDLQPARSITIPEEPITQGLDWAEREGDGALHSLRAVFNYRNSNYGVVDTNIDGQPFTYVTRFAEQEGERARVLYLFDGTDSVVHLHDNSDRQDGYPSALLTIRRTEEGGLEMINQSVHAIRLGLTSPEHTAERRGQRTGFTLSGVYQGLKQALGLSNGSGGRIDRRRWDSGLTSNIPTWKPDSFVPAQWARWKRAGQQPVGAH